MARGWESKEVESQMEAAASRKSQSQEQQLTIEEARMLRERESLQLSRTRVLQDIDAATHDGYRAMLERSLLFLDQKIAALPPAISKTTPRE
jgi:hypothetical protein